MKDRINMKHRVIVKQRVVTVVIAEWSFGSSFVRRCTADKDKLRFGSEAVQFATGWVAGHLQFLTCEQRRKDQLRYIFRQRCNRCEDQRGWPTQKHGHWKRLLEAFGLAVVKPATLLDLP